MPVIPLPFGGAPLHGGAVPVTSSEDVLAEFPRPQRNPASAPVRDAFAAAFAAGFIEYQRQSTRAALQSDPLYATGLYLKSFAEEHAVVAAPGESEESVRARLFLAPEVVTPDFIVAGVNAILAPHSPIGCHLSELELDGWFVHDGDAEWDSFIGEEPDYPDRYYDETPYLLPGGAVPSWGYIRSFLLRVPPLELSDDDFTYVLDADDDGIFIGDGSDPADDSVDVYIYDSPYTSDELYAAIVGYVEKVKGQGITWSLVVDPDLS